MLQVASSAAPRESFRRLDPRAKPCPLPNAKGALGVAPEPLVELCWDRVVPLSDRADSRLRGLLEEGKLERLEEQDLLWSFRDAQLMFRLSRVKESCDVLQQLPRDLRIPPDVRSKVPHNHHENSHIGKSGNRRRPDSV